MGVKHRSKRRVGSKRRKQRLDTTTADLLTAISNQELIPVIGDTIRLGHIFDLDLDLCPGGLFEDEDDIGSAKYDTEDELTEMNVMEELADCWAAEIGYPLMDSDRLPRVAQFQVVQRRNSTAAKEDYLRFLRETLLSVAAILAKTDEDEELAIKVKKLKSQPTISFADIVQELDFPYFPEGKEDPLSVLVRLPIKIFLTTSHYDFIERALVETGKTPRSTLIFWNIKEESVEPEHRLEPGFNPSVDEPVVFHLFGMEQYPASMVLSEDDYLKMLWKLGRDTNETMIPTKLSAALSISALLLLGYRLEDWDLRILFHGLLNADREVKAQRRPSIAIHIDPEEQPLFDNTMIDEAKSYLKSYFDDADFGVKYQDSDEFIGELWKAWQSMTNGGKPS